MIFLKDIILIKISEISYLLDYLKFFAKKSTQREKSKK